MMTAGTGTGGFCVQNPWYLAGEGRKAGTTARRERTREPSRIAAGLPTQSWQMDEKGCFHERATPLKQAMLDKRAHVTASTALQELLDEVPPGDFTLSWVMGRLHERSFGIIMLLLALVAIAPGVSMLAGLLLLVPALQMIAGHTGPVFPRRIATRRLPSRHLVHIVQRAMPALRYLEKAVHPRWASPFNATKRVVGVVVLLLSVALLLVPVPLSNIPPALVVGLISLAYLEEDGALLSIALIGAFIVLGLMSMAIWQTVVGALWIGRIW
jgi:hypothetical protein